MGSLGKLVSFLFGSADHASYSRWTVGWIMVAGVAGGLASTGLLALINRALHSGEDEATGIGLGFLALCALLPVSRFVSQFLLVRLSQGLAFELRVRLSRSILAAPLRRLEQVGPARLLATLADDVGQITGAMANLPLVFLQATVVAGCLGYMGYLSWRLLLVVLAALFVGVLSYQLPVAAAQRRFRAAREGWDQVFGYFRGLTEGAKELKVHRPRRHAFMDDLLVPSTDDLRRQNVAGGTLYAVANSWGQILFFLVIGIILLLLPRYTVVPQPVLTGFTLAILYMLTPLDVLLAQLPILGRAAVAVGKVESLGLSLAEAGDDAGDAEVSGASSWQRLELAGVRHTFYREDADDTFSLGPIDLVLEPGELVYLVGGNGSGKTTLAKLMIGLYTPEKGEIRLDGEAVDDSNRDTYRQLFSVVFSDFYLFEVLLGVGGEKIDERARTYLQQLHLGHKVRVEDGRLSTLDLSQGQRKRLALLTAYLEDRPIYLFDEWAADQDPQFKEVFYLQIVPELKRRGKTVVVISHDDRYYGMAERILKLEHGSLVYDGPVAGLQAAGEAAERLPAAGSAA